LALARIFFFLFFFFGDLRYISERGSSLLLLRKGGRA